MKGLFITTEDVNNRNSGICKKIATQISVLNFGNNECIWVKPNEANVNSLIDKIKNRLLFCSFRIEWDKVQIGDVDYLYIRRPFIVDCSFISFLSRAKKLNPKLKIIFEIPTYPYDAEYMVLDLKDRPFLWKDRFYRRRMKKFVDRISTFTNDEEIFGIKTLQITNGINTDEVLKRKIRIDDSSIHLIGVAGMNWWHGYDRLIKGMKNYYHSSDKKIKVIFHLVGEGSESNLYRKLVSDNDLNSYVIFHGFNSGEELDAIYNLCDIGVGCLGAHRKGISVSSDLKSREYTSKGLPIITDCSIDVFPESDFDFIFKIPEDESDIDVCDLVNRYEMLVKKYGNTENLSNYIREIAIKKCDMKSTMKPILHYLSQ